MYPGTIGWWLKRHARRCGVSVGHGHGHGHGHGCGGGEGHHAWDERHAAGDGELGGGPFGVRRPLRFLAHKLDLDEKQVAALARVIDDIKTERAQAAVDNRRTLAAFADAVAAGTLDEAAVREAATQRVRSAERLRDAVVAALGKLHGLLDEEQRAQLAYLIRTGALSL